MAQFTKFVQPGAVRIAAASQDPVFAPVAFVNPDGKTVIVANASQAGSFTTGGLMPGVYGIRYSTAAKTVDSADIIVNSNGILTTSIPEAGTLTIYQKS